MFNKPKSNPFITTRAARTVEFNRISDKFVVKGVAEYNFKNGVWNCRVYIDDQVLSNFITVELDPVDDLVKQTTICYKLYHPQKPPKKNK